ncbi:hypothetical protein NQ314_011950 [Rhamnusium bicolor]|uniref:BESS domain-containing protein n=1 Tax=Rhamnusium bicolor TaxID=1586634 RepID=A0AAV8XFA5_9CUCU|nr:hypothetical protein NQ314_011950 [Rhamnusium bicolor]
MTNEENPLQTSTPKIGSMQPVQFIQIQPSSSLPMTTVQSTNQFSEDEDNNTNATKRMATVLEEVVALQKEERSDDAMGNKKFLLSLLPYMKKLPDDVNLEVRLQLMSVLQTYNSGKGFFVKQFCSFDIFEMLLTFLVLFSLFTRLCF